ERITKKRTKNKAQGGNHRHGTIKTDQRVKVIRCDNGTEFKNKEMNQFCERKGIKREFSVARTPQQNGVAERKNRTLIEAARTMLTDSKLPTTFWAKAVNTACYVQNRVLVTKPHNKTPYELFLGRKPALGFMRPFGCPVTILNTIDHLGKFDGKADEGFFVGYSINSKTFRVFNSSTRIVEENLHVQFSENTPNIAGSGPIWLFDIDALTKSINYKPVVAGNQSNGNAGTKACDDAGKARMETIPGKDYILLSLWTDDPSFSQSSKSYPDARFKPSGDDEKKVTEEPGKEGGDPSKEDKRDDQEKDASVSSTNNVNVASTNEVNFVGRKASIELLDDPNMSALEDIVYSDDEEDIGAEADMNNLDAFMPISPIPTTRIHKDHPVEQIIRDFNSAPQTRRMTKNLEEHVAVTVLIVLKTLLVLPDGCFKSACSFGSRKGIYDSIKLLKAWYETLSTYLLDKVSERKDRQDICLIEGNKYDMTVSSSASNKSRRRLGFLSAQDEMKYGEEVDVYLYRSMIVHDVPTLQDPDICMPVDDVACYQVKQKVSHLDAVKRIFRYLKGQPKMSIWYSKDSLFDLVAYTDSDYAGARLDRKSTIGATIKAKIVNGEVQLQALVDGKKLIITESTIRRDLQLEDAEGVYCLPNATIFEQLTLMGLRSKTTAWNEFSNTMASAIICLATNQKFNFSKYIFETMVKNLDNAGKFLMYLRKPKRKNTEIPQSSSPTDNVADKTVNEEVDDSLVRADTTASSLEVEQDSGNINKTRSKATLNEPSSPGTSSGSGPKCQETMRDTIAQTRRVKKLEQKKRSRTHGLKRLYKVGSSRRVESSDEEGLGERDASKPGEDSLILMLNKTLRVNVQTHEEMFGVNDLDGNEVIVESVDVVNTTEETRSVVEEVTSVIIPSTKPKAGKVVIQKPEQGQAPTPTVSLQQPSHVKVRTRVKLKKNKKKKKGLPEKKLNKWRKPT
ncbi:ribonuclease H-like domain-containing protein, partial [Tanacetum coccineum]